MLRVVSLHNCAQTVNSQGSSIGRILVGLKQILNIKLHIVLYDVLCPL